MYGGKEVVSQINSASITSNNSYYRRTSQNLSGTNTCRFPAHGRKPASVSEIS